MRKQPWFILAVVVAALLSLAFFAGACGGDGEEDGDGDGPEPTAADGGAGGEVDVSMTEFAFDLSADSVAAGTVSFNLTNDGTIQHDFLVIKTDEAPDKLPYDDETFQEKIDDVDLIGRVEEALEAGDSGILEFDLDAGSYVLICNIATHYEGGMHSAFTVE